MNTQTQNHIYTIENGVIVPHGLEEVRTEFNNIIPINPGQYGPCYEVREDVGYCVKVSSPVRRYDDYYGMSTDKSVVIGYRDHSLRHHPERQAYIAERPFFSLLRNSSVSCEKVETYFSEDSAQKVKTECIDRLISQNTKRRYFWTLEEAEAGVEAGIDSVIPELSAAEASARVAASMAEFEARKARNDEVIRDCMKRLHKMLLNTGKFSARS